MKRSAYVWIVAVVAALVLVGAVAAFAAQEKAAAPATRMGSGVMGSGMMGSGMMGSGMMGSGMMGSGMMGSGMMGACPMGGPTGAGTVTVSSDGVYVLAGNKLLKFDKNLKPIKEVEIKVEARATGATMRRLAQQCPISQPTTGDTTEPSWDH